MASNPYGWADSAEIQKAMRAKLSARLLNPLARRASELVAEMLPNASEVEHRAALAWMLYEAEDALGVLLTGALADAELCGAPLRKIASAAGSDTATLKRKYPRMAEAVNHRAEAKKTGRTFPVVAGKKRPGSPGGIWTAEIGPYGMTLGQQ